MSAFFVLQLVVTLMLAKDLHQITRHNMTKAVTGQAHTTGWVGGGGQGGKEGRCLHFQLEPYQLHVYVCLFVRVFYPHVNRLRIDNSGRSVICDLALISRTV